MLYPTPTNTRAEEEREETPAHKAINQRINGLKVYLKEDRTTPLQAHVVSRWTNPARETFDAATVIWTASGRPKAVCCLYTGREDRGYLSLGPGMMSEVPVVAELDGIVIWAPQRLGESMTAFRRIPDAPSPPETAAQRLLQMRQLAKRFRAELAESDHGVVNLRLRLQPTPIYRYELTRQRGHSPDIRDGGVFAFVMGTDPEGLLLIEARGAMDDYHWEYSLEKRTAWPVKVFLDGQPVVTMPPSKARRHQDFTWWVHETYEPAK
jgi:hypothetical protein